MFNCNKCSNNFSIDDSLVCAGCANNFHVKCSSNTLLTTQTLKSVKSYSCFKWFCKDCNSAYASVCDRFNEMTNKIKNNEEKYNEKLESVLNAVKQIEEKLNKNKSYSDVVKLPSNQKETVVYIKPKNPSDNRFQMKLKVKEKIDPTKLNICGILNAGNGGILIKCKDKETAEKVEDEVRKSLESECEVQIPTERNPRVKVVGIFDDSNIDSKLLSEKIVTQNSDIFGDGYDLKIVKTETSKRNQNYKNIILEVETEIYKRIMTEKKILVGWSRCSVFDAIDLKRCYNCNLFGHLGKDCKQPPVCSFCSRPHKLQECKSTREKCINCVRHNEKYRSNIDTKHAAWDKSCPIYKRKIELKKKSIKYE